MARPHPRWPRARPAALAGAAALALAGLAAAGTPARAQRPTFRATADAVRVDVSVRDRNRPVTGLTAADFELLDNGVPQEVADVFYESVPIDVTVGLDVSHSVTGGLLDQLRRSVRDLRDDLRPQDRLKLVAFNHRVRRAAGLGADRRRLEAALAGFAATGSTSVFDTIAVSLVAAADPERRHLVMLFTDGADTTSFSDAAALVDLARRTTPALGFVLAGGAGRRDPPALLARLAGETGGRVVSVAPGEDLSATFRRILDEFRTSYVLHFHPTGVERTGFHTIEVRVRRPGRLEIRARRGYVAG